jgi:glycosyltransferase involved in cell wall biosynthesis
MTQPLVSICLPNYNGRPFLQARMDSLLQQSLQDWELIVCDSNSSDGSWEFFQKFSADRRVRLFQVPREGIYAGWNQCLRRVSGKFVAIAPSDDTAAPEFLERMVGSLGRHPDVHLAICQYDCIDDQGAIIPKDGDRPSDCFGEWLKAPHRRRGLAEFLVHLIRGGSWTTITSVVFTEDLLKKTGLFLEHETPVVDQLWAAKAALHTDTLWIPERLATWRRHGDQGSSKWTRQQGWRQVELTARTIRECEPLIPGAWKQDPLWLEKLMWGAWHFYRACYGLNRETVRRHPGKFLADLAWNAVHEPGYVARRLASGLTWDADEYRNSSDYVHQLIKEWNVPWPPAPVAL